MNCPLCLKIESRASDFLFLTEFVHTSAFLHADQRYPGHCLLISKEHIEHTDEQSIAVQGKIFEEVATVARAIRQTMKPVRLNYELLGNQVPHLHWHVIPRYLWDPEPGSVIWVRPENERKTGCSKEDALELRRLILAQL